MLGCGMMHFDMLSFGMVTFLTAIRLNKEETWSEQELSAVRAMSAVLCCGPVFDVNGFNDDGYIYHWLDTLLSSSDEKVRKKLTRESIPVSSPVPLPQT